MRPTMATKGMLLIGASSIYKTGCGRIGATSGSTEEGCNVTHTFMDDHHEHIHESEEMLVMI